MKCKFEINQKVSIEVGDQEAVVVARAEYAAAEPSYLLRYAAPTGSTEAWWTESALKGAENA